MKSRIESPQRNMRIPLKQNTWLGMTLFLLILHETLVTHERGGIFLLFYCKKFKKHPQTRTLILYPSLNLPKESSTLKTIRRLYEDSFFFLFMF